MLAFHGSRDKVDFDFVGYNSRLDELQASFLRLFLTHLDEWNRGRREAAARYAELGLGDLVELPAGRARPHLPPLRLPLAASATGSARRSSRRASAPRRTTSRLCISSRRMRFLGNEPGSLPETERAAHGELLRAALADDPVEQQERVVDVVRSAVGVAAASMSGFRRHRLLQLLVDAGIVALSWFLAFELRFDQGLPVYYDTLLRRTILIVVAIKIAVFLLFGFHRRWWRYVSVHDMWGAARGVVVASLVADVTVYFVSPVHNVRLPRSIAVMDLLITMALIAGARLFARTVIERPRSGVIARGREVVVVGAGDAGRTVVAEMQRSRMLRYTPIGFVDDDPTKKNIRILGVRVLGTTADLPRIVRDYSPDEVLIAIPSASGEVRARVVEAAQAANVPVKTLPGLYELITGDVQLAQIRPVQVEDVLGREQVEVDMREVGAFLEGHTVLVTGAGGSIGAELCRQIARDGPGEARARRQRGDAALRDRARARLGARLHGHDPEADRRQEPQGDAPRGLREVPADDRLPCRRLQARAADGDASARVGAEQRRRDEDRRGARRRVRGGALRAHLDGQGGQPEDGDGPVEGAVRVDHRVARASP